MDRQQKIDVLKAIQAGVPVKIAVEFAPVLPIIVYKEGDKMYYNGRALTGDEVTQINKMKAWGGKVPPMLVYEDRVNEVG